MNKVKGRKNRIAQAVYNLNKIEEDDPDPPSLAEATLQERNDANWIARQLITITDELLKPHVDRIVKERNNSG